MYQCMRGEWTASHAHFDVQDWEKEIFFSENHKTKVCCVEIDSIHS